MLVLALCLVVAVDDRRGRMRVESVPVQRTLYRLAAVLHVSVYRATHGTQLPTRLLSTASYDTIRYENNEIFNAR